MADNLMKCYLLIKIDVSVFKTHLTLVLVAFVSVGRYSFLFIDLCLQVDISPVNISLFLLVVKRLKCLHVSQLRLSLPESSLLILGPFKVVRA